jgi:hypothetical protein
VEKHSVLFTTYGQVAELIRSKEMEMDAIACANPNVIREYNDRQKTIEQLEKEVMIHSHDWRRLPLTMCDGSVPQLAKKVEEQN